MTTESTGTALVKSSRLAPSWLDRFLIGLFPRWGLRRYRARATALVAARHYEAAAGGRRTEGWTRRSSDANVALQTSLVQLREHSRELIRNNAWARRAISVIANNTVGWGIGARATGERAADAAKIWDRWASSVSCDYDGRLNFAGIQSLVMQTVGISGEVLIMRHTAESADGLASPVRLRVLEPDFLDHNKNGATEGGSGGEIRQGVEFDSRGKRVAYWLYETHPGGLGLSPGGWVSKRIDAKDVAHVYMVERPGQVRGAPWFASAIRRLKDFDDFEDAQLSQQRIAACFGAFVMDMEGTAPTTLGERDSSNEKIEDLQPGQVQYLRPGQSVTFAQPPGAVDAAFAERQLRAAATCLGITYEDLTTDYSKVNFSSARLARIAHWRNVENWRWQMLIPQLCERVWQWVMSASIENVNGTPSDSLAVPGVTWAAPPMPMLEPEKEGLAYARLIRSGAITLYQMIRERGEDPEAHLAEIAEGNKKLDELKIWLDSDARRTSAAGLAQPETGAGASTETGETSPG
jgi:lambda family phage portal protein